MRIFYSFVGNDLCNDNHRHGYSFEAIGNSYSPTPPRMVSIESKERQTQNYNTERRPYNIPSKPSSQGVAGECIAAVLNLLHLRKPYVYPASQSAAGCQREVEL